MLNDDITFKKIYADLTLKVVDFGKSDEMDKAICITISTPRETIYPTKYLGDYDIEKYGDKIMIPIMATRLLLQGINYNQITINV